LELLDVLVVALYLHLFVVVWLFSVLRDPPALGRAV
jgi:hypothetical protein